MPQLGLRWVAMASWRLERRRAEMAARKWDERGLTTGSAEVMALLTSRLAVHWMAPQMRCVAGALAAEVQ